MSADCRTPNTSCNSQLSDAHNTRGFTTGHVLEIVEHATKRLIPRIQHQDGILTSKLEIVLMKL
eukprot:389613-Amphidinium_carterae.1